MENNQKMDVNPKNQVVERLRDAQNVLITVSNNPSVDQLSAAIGFTLLMNKLGKHATAVFSGKVPSTLEFLKPEATLEQNTDSLRDFIIALDKSKADKLRYKVEENVVKIFITPYRTSLSEADFDFSQGDFNVDVVVALGVDKQEHIDQAIQAHGRILHDATVIGVMAGHNGIDLGSINWQDPVASSLCEMLVSISEAFQSGLLDNQMATAFLTGIVAETDRFSNDKTTPKVMTMAAQLMAAGANQQLIATKLTLPPEPAKNIPTDLPPSADESDEGVISLHDQPGARPIPQPPKVDQISIDDKGELHNHDANDQTASVHDVKVDNSESDTVQTAQLPADNERPNYSEYVSEPPKSGGTLTANSEPEQLEPSTDPLSDIPQVGIVDSTVDGPSEPQFGGGAASSKTSTTDEDSDHDQLLGPSINEPKDTLDDIESRVMQFEEIENNKKNKMPDPDAARRAVDNAVIAAGPDFNRPEPIQALNAQPFPEFNQSDDQAAPPSVPPPLPIPLPQDDEPTDTVQPKDQDQNDNNLPTPSLDEPLIL
ncbi:MAG TPA: hypothetical protein VMR51_03145 [Patescibacteria group bacterium]|nr:hypothetical protein [Patescibacteria group bacterium]